MKLTQVKGNTYVLEGWELIPLYKTDDTHCILLDTGLWTERGELETALAEHHLTPIGIISSHVHPDHSINDRYFQKKYNLPVALSEGEAALCTDATALKTHFQVPSLEGNEKMLAGLILHPDLLIGHEDKSVEFQGAVFEIIHTPGHSPDHISMVTPDGVCYAGDALFSGKMLEAKVPLNHSHRDALDSYELFPHLSCDRYILAHYGVYDDVTELATANRHLILNRADRILSLVDHTMSEEEIRTAAFAHFDISPSDPFKTAMLEHNIRSYLPYLIEQGELESVFTGGVCRYQRTTQES